MSTTTLYKNRPAGIMPVSISMDKEAVAYVKQHAVGAKGMGRFLSRLVYEKIARDDERERLAAEQQETTEAD
jgi:hypothetical protein